MCDGHRLRPAGHDRVLFVSELTEFPPTRGRSSLVLAPRGRDHELRRGSAPAWARCQKIRPSPLRGRLDRLARSSVAGQNANRGEHGTCQLSALFGDGASRFSNLANEQQVVLLAEEGWHDGEDHVIAQASFPPSFDHRVSTRRKVKDEIVRCATSTAARLAFCLAGCRSRRQFQLHRHRCQALLPRDRCRSARPTQPAGSTFGTGGDGLLLSADTTLGFRYALPC